MFTSSTLYTQKDIILTTLCGRWWWLPLSLPFFFFIFPSQPIISLVLTLKKKVVLMLVQLSWVMIPGYLKIGYVPCHIVSYTSLFMISPCPCHIHVLFLPYLGIIDPKVHRKQIYYSLKHFQPFLCNSWLVASTTVASSVAYGVQHMQNGSISATKILRSVSRNKSCWSEVHHSNNRSRSKLQNLEFEEGLQFFPVIKQRSESSFIG